MLRVHLTPTATLAVVLVGIVPAWGEHAKITLDVIGPSEQKTAFMDQTPPAHGKNPRPVVHARVGEPVKIQWLFTNIYPHKTLTDVVVHLFVARQEAIGQKLLPEIDEDVVVETAFDMDFRPGGKAGGRQTLRIDQPGVYLVRVESRQTGSDHEHFAAIDLVIEPAGP
jgi:hypothetical protein